MQDKAQPLQRQLGCFSREGRTGACEISQVGPTFWEDTFLHLLKCFLFSSEENLSTGSMLFFVFSGT